jgi:hypothetical protein
MDSKNITITLGGFYAIGGVENRDASVEVPTIAILLELYE